MRKLRPLQSYGSELCPRVLPQCVRLLDIRCRGDSLLVSIVRHRVGAVIVTHRILEQLRRRIRAAQLEVIGRELSAQGKLHRREIRGARLGFGPRGGGGVAQPPEEIDFPGEADVAHEIVIGACLAVQQAGERRVGRGTLARRRCVRIERWGIPASANSGRPREPR